MNNFWRTAYAVVPKWDSQTRRYWQYWLTFGTRNFAQSYLYTKYEAETAISLICSRPQGYQSNYGEIWDESVETTMNEFVRSHRFSLINSCGQHRRSASKSNWSNVACNSSRAWCSQSAIKWSVGNSNVMFHLRSHWLLVRFASRIGHCVISVLRLSLSLYLISDLCTHWNGEGNA